jgi:hypothetical protein
MIPGGRRTTFVARGAALRRPRTSMVTTERSAPSEWEERPGILARLRAWSAKHPLRPEGGGPPALCDPDEIPIVWMQHSDRDAPPRHGRSPRDPRAAVAGVVAVVAALERAVNAEVETEIADARAALSQAALGVCPKLCRAIARGLAERGVALGDVQPHVRWLLRTSAYGEALELAIFLVAATGDRGTVDELLQIGRHPWLWRPATWALDSLGVDTLDLTWARAASLSGTRRRRILEGMVPRLAGRADIRDWILRHGRGASPEPGTGAVELIGVCAAAGDLAGALAAIDVDDELLDIACSTMTRLLGNHLGDTIEGYPDGVLAVDRLVGHLLDRCGTIARLGCVYSLLVWLEEPSILAGSVRLRRTVSRIPPEEFAMRWERREALGWTVEIMDALADDCLRILRRAESRDLVRATFTRFETESWKDLDLAWRIAPTVGLDLWPDAFRLLQRHPFDSSLYHWLLETDDVARAEEVIQFAAHLVPWRAPDDATMFPSSPRGGLGFSAVCSLMDGMRRHGLYNKRLVASGLYADDTVVRDWPAGVLKKRSPDTWGDEVIAAIRSTPASCGCFEPTRRELLAMLPGSLA